MKDERELFDAAKSPGLTAKTEVQSRVATRKAFESFWALALLALMAATFRLWMPSSWVAGEDLPAVPLFDPALLGLTTTLMGWLSSVLVMVSVVVCLLTIAGRNSRTGWAVLAISLCLLIAMDQHRLQPWVYQTILYATLFSFASAGPIASARDATLGCIRWLTITVYVFSAIGKFDFQFLHTVGQDFLRVPTNWFGLDVSDWSDRTRLVVAAFFPTFELLVAASLAVPPVRRVGVWMAIIMHLGLIAVLSPMGLGHSAGVIVWNLVMAIQAWMLFRPRPAVRPEHDSEIVSRASAGGLSWSVVILASVMPLTERRGYWDHWMSWALYSPHNSRMSLQIHESAIESLPEPWRAAVVANDADDRWHDLELGRLSLMVRGVPALPQSRYQWALTDAIRQKYPIENAMRGKVQSASDRWTGQREEQWWTRPDEFQRSGETFWLVP
ncbi:hypothetical protein LOC71_02835 [Rhodopirellula sp. JC740]|uniref:HTTM domain-containing protein n=1 Tax=Rhodopirellula halodulae TaxID=2894198 RepID=A0ABS8NCB4_9BACT|nr:hypothetical protein [Rhodopirellula sp. JC740]